MAMDKLRDGAAKAMKHYGKKKKKPVKKAKSSYGKSTGKKKSVKKSSY
tara:strand:- start:3017 stop:3160 length:144 start_codon:yes stop_codon:yes gene_type:complete